MWMRNGGCGCGCESTGAGCGGAGAGCGVRGAGCGVRVHPCARIEPCDHRGGTSCVAYLPPRPLSIVYPRPHSHSHPHPAFASAPVKDLDGRVWTPLSPAKGETSLLLFISSICPSPRRYSARDGPDRGGVSGERRAHLFRVCRTQAGRGLGSREHEGISRGLDHAGDHRHWVRAVGRR